MEELLEGIDCSLRVSGMIGDSIMMGIVNSAMEEAYDRILCSEEGGLECLNDKSRFCGLAIMQLEWCLRFLQGEVDACVVRCGEDRERLLGDLRATRDRIRRRLEETESAIAEKEWELADMNQSESELRRALESKDEELRSLRTSLELERARNGGMQEEAEDREVNVGELRMSIFQQMEDFSCKLVEVKTHISDLVQKLGMHCSSTMGSVETKLTMMEEEEEEVEEGSCDFSDKIVGEVKYMSPNGGRMLQCPEVDPNSDAEVLTSALRRDLNDLFKQLDLEMGVLKRRLLLAFEATDEAICLSKAAVDEQQLRWMFEKDALYVLVGNFVRDVEESCHSKCLGEAGNIPPTIMNISWSSLMKNFAVLHSNLEQLAIELDGQLGTDGFVESPTSHLQYLASENSTDCLNHFDSKVESNHQSIVRNETQEAACLWAVEKEFPFFRNFREFRSMKTKITEISSKLECFIEETSKLAVVFDDFRSANEMERCVLQDNLSRSESAEKVNEVAHASSDIPTKVGNETSYSMAADTYGKRIRYLKEDREDSFLKSIVLEETNAIFFNVFVKELYGEFADYKLETFLREDVCWLVFIETMKERNCEVEICDFERGTMEEMDQVVFSNLIKDMKNTDSLGFKGCGEKNLSCPSIFSQGPYSDENIVQGTGKLSMSFGVEEDLLPDPWSQIMEPQMHLVRNSQVASEQSLNHTETLYDDADDDDDEAFSLVKSRLEKALQQLTNSKMQLSKFGSDLGVSLEEKEHTIVKFGQDIEQTSYLHIMNGEEGCNENQSVLDKEQTSCLRIKNEEGCSENQPVLDKEQTSCLLIKNGEEGCNENQHVLDKEQTSRLHIKNGEENCIENQTVFDKEQTLCLHIKNREEGCNENQPVLNKKKSSCLHVKNGKEGSKEIQPVLYKEQTSCQQINNAEEGCSEIHLVVAYLTDFLQDISALELVAYEKIKANMLRLEGLNSQLNLLVQQASSLRKTELLYRKAFIRRCYNLQTAEAEVDLLGDEVDALLSLLEKIYIVLDYYSPVLQYYSGIMDILKLIKKELCGDASVQSHT